jgi:hypothetical protein
MSVVKALADVPAVNSLDIDDAAGLRALGRLFNQTLENPRMGGVPSIFQADTLDQFVHACIVSGGAGRLALCDGNRHL